MNHISAFFQQQGFSPEDANQIATAFKTKELAKGDLFVEVGKPSQHLAIVEQGFLQYFVLVDGEEKTTYTVSANGFAVSLIAFLRNEKARESIRAVVDSTLWVISKKSLDQLLKEIPAFKDFYLGLMEWQICCIDESRLDAITLSAQERYEKMMSKEPELIQQIPLQYLASILGVTPRHLSRIRSNVRKSNGK
jgi:CRP/FNR family transcriptional regulator, anaerobic regulatory protein